MSEELPETTRQAFIEAARQQYGEEGAIEIDDNAEVSKSGEDGAYVAAWVFVYKDSLEEL